MSKVIKTLALAMVFAASASALAQSPPPYWGSYGYPGEGAVPAPAFQAFPIAPYGNANPSYSSYYGTYPAYTWDSDPYLRAQMRSDFNRGVYTK